MGDSKGDSGGGSACSSGGGRLLPRRNAQLLPFEPLEPAARAWHHRVLSCSSAAAAQWRADDVARRVGASDEQRLLQLATCHLRVAAVGLGDEQCVAISHKSCRRLAELKAHIGQREQHAQRGPT